jgi:hypothetical protein
MLSVWICLTMGSVLAGSLVGWTTPHVDPAPPLARHLRNGYSIVAGHLWVRFSALARAAALNTGGRMHSMVSQPLVEMSCRERCCR